MRRREFLGVLSGAAAAWPLAAHAQQPAKLRTIGFLSPNTASAQAEWNTAFVQRLRELGWVEGRTVTIEYRWAEGRYERLPDMAAELVRLKADVIVTSGPATAAAKQATSIIPIVFGVLADPIGTGIVSSLSRPGGNITGLSMQNSDLAAKRLELLRELVPGFRRLAIAVNLENAGSVIEMGEVQVMASELGLEVTKLEFRRAEDIAPAFKAVKGRADALYICGDPLVSTNRGRINILALGARLPAIWNFRDHAVAGGLISYGANQADLFRRAADFVDQIFRGAKPADIPVEQPTKFDLVVNLITAQALDLTVPQAILARANELIE